DWSSDVCSSDLPLQPGSQRVRSGHDESLEPDDRPAAAQGTRALPPRARTAEGARGTGCSGSRAECRPELRREPARDVRAVVAKSPPVAAPLLAALAVVGAGCSAKNATRLRIEVAGAVAPCHRRGHTGG